jgi:hypothetical protein
MSRFSPAVVPDQEEDFGANLAESLGDPVAALGELA